MIRKRIMSLLIVGMVSTSLLVGCSEKANETNTNRNEGTTNEVQEINNNDDNVVPEPNNNKEVTNNKKSENVNNIKQNENKSEKNEVNQNNSITEKPSSNVDKPSAKPINPQPNNKVETPVQSDGDYLARVEEEIFNSTNAERQKQGLPALKRDATANKYARSKSLEMLNLNYFDHKSPQNGYIHEIAKRDGWNYSRIGENIYTMTGGEASNINGASITNSWMNSEGHRKNILNRDYTHLGVGVAYRNGKLYATQIFYTPL